MTVVKIKKQRHKKVYHKKNLNLKIIKTQVENKINYLEKNKLAIDSFYYYKRKHTELIKKTINQH